MAILTQVVATKTIKNVTARIELRVNIAEQNASTNTTKLSNVTSYLVVENNSSTSVTTTITGYGYAMDGYVFYANTNPVTVKYQGTDYTLPVASNSEEVMYKNTTSFATFTLDIAPGETQEAKVFTISQTKAVDLIHNIDGTLQLMCRHSGIYVSTKSFGSGTEYFFNEDLEDVIIDIPTLDRALIPLTADDFTDEENPSFSFSTEGVSALCYSTNKSNYTKQAYPKSETGVKDYIDNLEVALSFDGETIDIPYREVPIDGTRYTIDLTEAERELLRQKAQGSPIVPIYYVTRVKRKIDYTYTSSTSSTGYTTEYHDEAELVGKLQRNLTVVGCNPSLNSDVWDIKEETLALTGDENTVIRYESMVEFAVRATASKHAEIVSQSVTCGSKTVEDLPYGVIDDVESGTFIFKATDSRNLVAEAVVEKNLIEYIKPTCYQKLAMEMASEFGTRVVLTVSGNCYNGSFGAVDNTLKLEARYTQEDGSMGDWVELEGTPTFNGNAYSLEVKIEGFTYSKAYTFQCRATDKLNYVQSAEYTLRIYPVFDWGENDFNFNVPIKMNEETVLRHNADAKNTVLSASGGHIYIRPGGTDSTSGELMIKPDGDVLFGGEVEVNSAATFNGEVNLNGTVLIDGVDLNDLLQPEEEDVIVPADYVIETGEEAMGTNGTWYWTKWANGRAECYGRRNFGSAAMSTSVTNGYRSAEFTQDLPSGLFTEAPDCINMTPYPNAASNYDRVFISPAATAASATSTGGFYLIRLTSGTAAATDVSFDIKGRWK